MKTETKTCVCKKCHIEKPHTQEYFYAFKIDPSSEKIYRHYTCILCQRKISYYNRKIRQAVARVDRYEKRFIKKIKAEVDKEIKQTLRERKILSLTEKKFLTAQINKDHAEAIKENTRIDKKKLKALKKIAYIEREKIRKVSPEYKAAQRRRYYARKERKLKEETHNPLPRISPDSAAILEWTPGKNNFHSLPA